MAVVALSERDSHALIFKEKEVLKETAHFPLWGGGGSFSPIPAPAASLPKGVRGFLWRSWAAPVRCHRGVLCTGRFPGAGCRVAVVLEGASQQGHRGDCHRGSTGPRDVFLGWTAWWEPAQSSVRTFLLLKTSGLCGSELLDSDSCIHCKAGWVSTSPAGGRGQETLGGLLWLPWDGVTERG